uniref:Uncharacterized protein n=1 Tax=Rhizophora mucronata TaxID=61149 RepID=A0A2P2QIX9_RHIMU
MTQIESLWAATRSPLFLLFHQLFYEIQPYFQCGWI